jgi:hypothetical protein
VCHQVDGLYADYNAESTIIKGYAHLPGSGGKGSGTRAAGSSGGVGRTKTDGATDEEMEYLDVKGEQDFKVRAPLFEEDTFYPTVIPFRHVDAPADPNALSRSALPEELSMKVCHVVIRLSYEYIFVSFLSIVMSR